MNQLAKIAHEKNGNPKSSADFKKPKELRFFDFFFQIMGFSASSEIARLFYLVLT